MSRFVVFSNCKTSDNSNLTVFARGANSREWGTARPSRAYRAWPGPWYVQITGRSLTQPARFLFQRSSATPGSRHSISQGVCLAWPVTSSGHFRVLSSSCGSSFSKFRGHNLLVSPRPAVSLGSRPLPTSGVRSRVCHAPIPTFGYRWCAWVA